MADTTSPTTPSGLAVASVSQNSVSIRWSSSTDNVGVVGYAVYKDGAPAGNTTGTTFLVPSVTCGTTVVLGVEARDAAGNRSKPATVSAAAVACTDTPAPTIPPPPGHSTVADTTSPTTPSGLAVASVSQNSVSIRWSSSTDDVGVVGYAVYKDGAPAGNNRLVAAGEVDDGETARRQGDRAVDERARAVRAAVAKRLVHALERPRVDGASVERGESADPAHGS